MPLFTIPVGKMRPPEMPAAREVFVSRRPPPVGEPSAPNFIIGQDDRARVIFIELTGAYADTVWKKYIPGSSVLTWRSLELRINSITYALLGRVPGEWTGSGYAEPPAVIQLLEGKVTANGTMPGGVYAMLGALTTCAAVPELVFENIATGVFQIEATTVVDAPDGTSVSLRIKSGVLMYATGFAATGVRTIEAGGKMVLSPPSTGKEPGGFPNWPPAETFTPVSRYVVQGELQVALPDDNGPYRVCEIRPDVVTSGSGVVSLKKPNTQWVPWIEYSIFGMQSGQKPRFVVLAAGTRLRLPFVDAPLCGFGTIVGPVAVRNNAFIGGGIWEGLGGPGKLTIEGDLTINGAGVQICANATTSPVNVLITPSVIKVTGVLRLNDVRWVLLPWGHYEADADTTFTIFEHNGCIGTLPTPVNAANFRNFEYLYEANAIKCRVRGRLF